MPVLPKQLLDVGIVVSVLYDNALDATVVAVRWLQYFGLLIKGSVACVQLETVGRRRAAVIYRGPLLQSRRA